MHFESTLDVEIDNDEPPEALRVPAATRGAVVKNGPLRLLMVVESSAAGTGRHVLDLCEALLARGCDVHLLYSPIRADRLFLDRVARSPKLHLKAVPMRRNPHPGDVKSAWAIRQYLRCNGPFDVIHGHSSKGGALARVAALGTGIPAVYTPHGLVIMDPHMAGWKRMLYQAIEIGLSLRTRRIIAVAPEERRVAVRAGLGKSRVVVVPNGVEQGGLTSRDDARRAIGVTDQQVVFGFVGRLVDDKAPHKLIDAFAAAARAEPRARLALIGDGPLAGAVRRRAIQWGIEGSILWLGERNARPIVPAFDVFTIPSRKEGLPYVVLEAMAAGLPVVATDTAGVEILVDSGTNGTVVACDDIAAFAAAMVALATDPQLRARYGRASRKRVSYFSIEAMVEKTLEAYRKPLAPAEPLAEFSALDDVGPIASKI